MKHTLALVDYLNTLPFSIGLKQTGLDAELEILRVTPSACAQLFELGRADISLCPVGALPDMPPHEIRGNYCIGADGAVGTVMLLSRVPLNDITSVSLDGHSRTSNLLLQLIAKRAWKKDWMYYFDQSGLLPETCLMIGDKVFHYREHYPYRYDLATAWKELTGLPVVFAVWIARPGIPATITRELDEAFTAGMEEIRTGRYSLAPWQKTYLLGDISYPLDDAKKNAMHLYLEWTRSLFALPVQS